MPAGMLEYARDMYWRPPVKDVLDVVAEHLENAPGKTAPCGQDRQQVYEAAARD